MSTRIARALALLALGLLGAPSACAAGDAGASPVFKALPSAPNAYVTDHAQILSPEAQARLTERLKRLRDTSAFVRLYVYTLRSANGAPPADAAQELYRRWRMKDRELWDGLATVFVFRDEKKTLVMLGQGAPARAEEALAGVSPDLAAIFGDDPEGALSRVIDRIDKSLEGDTSSWIDSPPVPAEPGGPVYGNPPFEDAGVAPALEEAVRRASTPEHPIVLVLNPARGLDSPAERSEKLGKAWPGRIILACYSSDFSVTLTVPDVLADRFPDEQRSRLRHEVKVAMTRASFPRTLTRVVGEIASLAEGRPLAPWIEWRHPLKTLGGGQDEDPAPLAAGVGIAAVLLFLVLWFLYTLLTNPMAIVAVVAEGAIEGLIGGLFGGGGGFSGGGGSFGGGGASGSW